MMLLKVFRYKINSFIKCFSKCKLGTTSIEYAILLSAVATTVYLVFRENGNLHQALVSMFSSLTTAIISS